jgi:hypothetical protein
MQAPFTYQEKVWGINKIDNQSIYISCKQPSYYGEWDQTILTISKSQWSTDGRTNLAPGNAAIALAGPAMLAYVQGQADAGCEQAAELLQQMKDMQKQITKVLK